MTTNDTQTEHKTPKEQQSEPLLIQCKRVRVFTLKILHGIQHLKKMKPTDNAL